MATSLGALAQVIVPKRVGNGKGTGQTPTFNPANAATVLTAPTYRDHLTEIFSSRASDDGRTLIKMLMVQDPDMSASVNAFLTVADTRMVYIARDMNDVIDRAGQTILTQLINLFTTRMDYSKGFKVSQTLNSVNESMRYMLLMRGGAMAELVLSKEAVPSEVRHIDLASVKWYEKQAGLYSPAQTTKDGKEISLDVPTIFASWFRKDPTEIYSNSPFISSINTIAARQQVINDLYRIMQLTGYPRLEVTVLEEVAMKNAPRNAQTDPTAKKQYLDGVLGDVRRLVSNIRPDQAFIHWDSAQVGMINDKNPGMALDISQIISTLNAQNQAGLRTMATIIGRGESGVNTASVEARVFSLNAQALNEPIADLWSQILTFALRLTGSQSRVEVYFLPVEMRSETELETQMVVRQTRLRTDLSDGLISDDEYHLWMYGRLAPEGTPLMSGTGFLTQTAGVDVTNISPNSDPLGKSVSAPGGNKGARDNKTKPNKK